MCPRSLGGCMASRGLPPAPLLVWDTLPGDPSEATGYEGWRIKDPAQFSCPKVGWPLVSRGSIGGYRLRGLADQGSRSILLSEGRMATSIAAALGIPQSRSVPVGN